jgi:hypothetical protein
MLKACLVGASVTFALIVIPVVHFLTAIPSPFIGGYFAGSRSAATPGQGLLIGGIMALLLVVPAMLAFLLPALFFGLGIEFIIVAGIVYGGWCAMLGSLGAVLGGSSVRGQQAQRQPAQSPPAHGHHAQP